MTEQPQAITQPKITLQDKMMIEAMNTSSEVFNPIVYTHMRRLAEDMIKAKALPRGIETAEQAIVIMQFGSEVGIKPLTALQSVYIVNGRLTMWGSMVISRLTNSGYKVEYSNETDNSCTVKVSKDGMEYAETYTYDMADKSGYTRSSAGEKVGWKLGTNRKLKLRYGAISMILKTYLPHLLNGAEITEVWQDVESKPELPRPNKEVSKIVAPAPQVTDLLKK